MRSLFFLPLCFFIFLNANSQNSANNDTSPKFDIAIDGHLRTSGFYYHNPPNESTTKGNVYLFSNFNGIYNVLTKNGEIKQLFNLNYNLLTQTLESFISKDTVFQYDLNQIEYVISENNKYRVNSDGKWKGLSLEMYNSEKLKLFKYFSIITKKAIHDPLTLENIAAAEYGQNVTYYLSVKGEEIKIRLSKNDILHELNDKKEAVKEYVNVNKLSFSSEEDVCKILKYYDSI
ncbi:hypothetical protein [Flavobacterium laiguense]|uniref:GLPGLI family protein n=1 Tax=Flavobacterium laiguense TaxID=2169409 RepID=A0A2U1JXC0_9FLAO|nr:hypothetical protein [Flavobacterium laiguense]PWA09871.1 hypothetical protein DB891_06760 [Flavobacterium laiguense]